MGACCCTQSRSEGAVQFRSTDNTGVKKTQLNVRDLAPQWSGQAVVNGVFKEISLDDYKGKYLVLFFYPLDFSFVCPTEIIAFSDRIKEFKDIGCEIVACSTDSVYSHFAWTSQPAKQGGLGPVNFPLLSDSTHKIAKAYNVYKDDDGTTYRGLFVIDISQKVRQMTVNDCQVGRSVDETLRLVQAFQYTDIHGEVCQAGWKPGDGGLKTNKCMAPCPPSAPSSPPSSASTGKH